MRKIEDCHDERIKAARYKMRDTQSAYKAAIRERNELLVKLHNTEYHQIDTLVELFGMARDSVEKVITDAEPIRPKINKGTSQSSASMDARSYIK